MHSAGYDLEMRKIPHAVYYCLTAAFIVVVVTLGWLEYTQVDSTEFTRFLNTVLNLINPVISSFALIYAGKAAQQTNGDLDQRITQAIKRGNLAHTTTEKGPQSTPEQR